MTAPNETPNNSNDNNVNSNTFFSDPSQRIAAMANNFMRGSPSPLKTAPSASSSPTSKSDVEEEKSNHSPVKVPTNISQIENIIGFISEQYHCEHSNFAGILYAGPLAVVWLGRIFFFEWTVIIKWEDVIQVQKQEDGVRFHMCSNNGNLSSTTYYNFTKLFHPEKAWSRLVSLHNDSVIDKLQKEPTPRQVTRSLRRNNSDPLMMSFVLDETNGVTDSDRRPIMTPRRKKRDLMVRTESEAIGSEDDDIAQQQQSPDNLDPKPTLKLQWSSVVERMYKQKAVERHELQCSLQSFTELFIEDTAEYSIHRFMKESGDEEIQCSVWKSDDTVGSGAKTRTIEYTHPVNAPMAPPMARAKKEQTYTSFGTLGLVLETKTYVSDVPMTDCFYVTDQIRVESTSETSVVVTMSFDLEFVKSTMFRAIIMRTTKSEFERFMNRLANFMSQSLVGQATTTSSSTPPTPIAVLPEHHQQQHHQQQLPTSPSEWFPIFAAIFLTLILLLQMWILLDIRSIKMAIVEIQSTWHAECPSKIDNLMELVEGTSLKTVLEE